MNDKLRKHIDGLFSETIPTKKAVELKEEMIQNLEDRYKELISEGKTEEAAYNIAIAGIGDVSGLLEELGKSENATAWMAVEHEKARHKSAMLTSIAVMLYILSTLPLIILSLLGSRLSATIGIPLLFLSVAAATGILIYNSMTKPRLEGGSETMVEEFRQWQSGAHQRKSLRAALSSVLWPIITILYFVISFSSGAWHISWIIFILGVAIEAIINIFMNVIPTLRK